jgi:subtilase family serine protease
VGILITLVLSGDVITAAERQVLKGHVPKDLPALAAIGRLEKSQRLNLAIGLPLRNKPTLIKLIAALYDPANPQYRRYLTPNQFTALFGPTEGDYAALVDFANANG